MGEYTKGPWSVFGTKHPVGDTFGVKSGVSTWVAKCHPFNGTKIERQEAEANAHLIAAAPDLLEALIKIKAGLDDETKEDFTAEIYDIVEAAIRKAEGHE